MSVRPPAVAGRFYPKDPAELRAVVATLFADARAESKHAVVTPYHAVLTPHAGYIYSGPTAARVFARVAIPGLVVMIAPNHTGVCEVASGISLWETGAFRTPLGDVAIDRDVATTLQEISQGAVAIDHEAHRSEHAIEVELPFLQLLRADVRIVPLVIASDAWSLARALGEWLARLVQATGERVLLLASSDLNHYEPALVSERKDARALEALTTLDGEELLARCKNERISMCGRGPAASVLAAVRALGAKRAEVVDYRHSGWVSGDNARVVGYAGVVIS